MGYNGYNTAGPGGGGGGGAGGSLYWEWNGLDDTQFGPRLVYESDFGTAPAGTTTLSVVPAAIFGPNALRLTMTGVGGGSFHPILDLPGGVLPQYYSVEFTYIGFVLTGGQGGPAFVLMMSDTINVLDGLTFALSNGGASVDLGQVYNGEQDAAPGIYNAAAWSAAEASRGTKFRAECWRQAGTTPQSWHVLLQSAYRTGVWQGAASSTSDGAVTAARFAGKNMNLIGPGYYSGGAVFTGTLDIVGMRIVDLAA